MSVGRSRGRRDTRPLVIGDCIESGCRCRSAGTWRCVPGCAMSRHLRCFVQVRYGFSGLISMPSDDSWLSRRARPQTACGLYGCVQLFDALGLARRTLARYRPMVPVQSVPILVALPAGTGGTDKFQPSVIMTLGASQWSPLRRDTFGFVAAYRAGTDWRESRSGGYA